MLNGCRMNVRRDTGIIDMKMSQDEFIEEYGEEFVKFESYYKFEFRYAGTTKDGFKIVVRYGGISDDIYRHEVCCDPERVASIYPDEGIVFDKDGRVVAEMNERI